MGVVMYIVFIVIVNSMKKWSRMIKTSLGVEDKAFHGTGRKLGGAPTEVQPPSTHPQVCRTYM